MSLMHHRQVQILLNTLRREKELVSVELIELLVADLYDCDFNQQLGLSCPGEVRHLRDLIQLEAVPADQPIHTAPHCFGCTAGAG